MLSALRSVLIRWLGDGNKTLKGKDENVDLAAFALSSSGGAQKNQASLVTDVVLVEYDENNNDLEVHPEYINDVLLKIIQAEDIYNSIDQAISEKTIHYFDVPNLYLLLSDHFKNKEDKLTAIHFLNMARDVCDKNNKKIYTLLIKKYIAIGRSEDALDLVVNPFLLTTLYDLDEEEKKSIQASYKTIRSSYSAKSEHGHDLLVSYCRKNWSKLSLFMMGRKPIWIEIGSTRENVPGQGSSRIIAQFCKEKNIDFISVDMDPHNTKMASDLFLLLKTNFKAVNMKGEDYLRNFEEVMDFVFLDAYDFDHGKHSNLRQSRYKKFLGSSINDAECHQMHLDCAESIAKKLAPHGLVCVDDTWLENGHWTAKGTLAMPFLLANGFEVLEARNRAALLARVPMEGAP